MRIYKLAFVVVLGIQCGFGASHADEAPVSSTVPDTFKDLQRVVDARSHEQAREVAAKEQHFIESFNRLAAALETFSKTYRVTHSVDTKQVKSIRDAYRKLERSDPWFRVE